VLTCSGDRSSGVEMDTQGSGSAYTTLNVNKLTTNIAPPAGTAGIEFMGNGTVIVNVDLGPWRIVTTDEAGVSAGNLTSDGVDITVAGSIETMGDNAAGIVSYTPDGAETIRSLATITTHGDGSHGIFATTQTGQLDVLSTGDISTSGVTSHAIYAVSDSGPIAIKSFGRLTTTGNNATGISATSDTGNITILSAGKIVTSGASAAGIFAETDGMGLLEVSGDITTSGSSADGILLTARGGALLLTTGKIATAGDFASGIAITSESDIAVLSAGDITTQGQQAHGVFAETTIGSIGVVTGGNVITNGADANGILVNTSSGDLVVATAGTVQGGSGTGAGVKFIDGGSNILLNYGRISALSGTAIVAGGADESVYNLGTVTGSVDLGLGANSFQNFAGAIFNSGAIASVGTFVNEGTLAPGGIGAIQMTVVDDTFTQTASGIYAVDLDAASTTSDQVIVSDTASVGGTVKVSVTTLPSAARQSYTILQALSGVTDTGLALLASPALGASLAFTATDVVLSTSVNFATGGLNPNQRSIARALNGGFNAGGGGLTPLLIGLLNVEGDDAYKAALNQLSPELYADAQISTLYASLGFANNLLSCRVNGPGTASIIYEGQCLWAGASAVFFDQDSTADRIGSSETSGLFAAGAQVKLNEFWRFGFGASYQRTTLDTPTAAQSEGELAQGGVALKYNTGSVVVAGTVTAGHGWYDTKRPIAFGGFSGLAESTPGIDVVNGGMRIGYVFGEPQLYFKPVLDMAATWLGLGDFAESGAGAANLYVAGTSKTIYTVLPSLEVGTEWWLSNGTLVRPFVRTGLAWYSGGDFALDASFLAAPAGVSPFTIHTGLDNAMGTIGAGLDMVTGDETALHLSYDGQFGETASIQTFGMKGSVRF
jgi:uncharacterized protein with beta-barrel porin domain